jgi:WhiB family redox-sensing transcriptional regulator
VLSTLNVSGATDLAAVDPAAAAELLSALRVAPDLPRAACVGEREVFDNCLEPGGKAHAAYALAVRICAQCPALPDCAAWIDSLPAADRPFGVTAGQIRRRGWRH